MSERTPSNAPQTPVHEPADGTDPTPSPSAMAAGMVSLYNVMDDLLEPMVVADHRATILRVNKATLRLFGYLETELIGQNVSLLCEPSVAKVHHRYVERFLTTRLPVVIGTAGREVRGQHKNGTLLPLRLSMAETKQNGQSLFIAQLHDLRPIKTREEELRVFSQVNKTIVERTSAEIHERIMHSVAHELRNPLQTISGCLYLLKQSFTHLSSADVTLITEIDDSIRRCCRVLDNAVNVCNYQTRKLTLDPAYERTRVEDLLRSVETHLRAFTTAPLVVLVDDTVPDTVYLNAKHTLQILKYAVANAIKFTIRGDLVMRCTVEPSGGLLRFELDYVTLLGSRGPPVAPWLLPVTETSSPALGSAPPAAKFDLALAMAEPAHHVECDPQLLIPPSHPLPAHLRSANRGDLLRLGAANGCSVASSIFNASPASSFSAASHSAAATYSADLDGAAPEPASLTDHESPGSDGESPLPNLRAISSHTLPSLPAPFPAPPGQPAQPQSAPLSSFTIQRVQSKRTHLLQLATGGSSDGSSAQSSPATEPAVDAPSVSSPAEGAGEGGDFDSRGRSESSVYSFSRAQSHRANGPGLSPSPLPAPCQHCVSHYAKAGSTDPNRLAINNLYSSNSGPDTVHKMLSEHAQSTIAIGTVSVAPEHASSAGQQSAPASSSVAMSSSELSTEHMWQVTRELVHAMGGKCGLEVVGCFDEELPNSDELTLPHNSVQYIQSSSAAKPIIDTQAQSRDPEVLKRPVIRSMKDLNISIPEPAHPLPPSLTLSGSAGPHFLLTSNGISAINNAAIQSVLNSLSSHTHTQPQTHSGSPSLASLASLAASASTPSLPLDPSVLPPDSAPRPPVTATAASGNRSPPRRRIGHFTNKRYWFTVPFSVNPRTVSAEDQKSAALNDELVKGHAIKVGGNEMPSGAVGVTSSAETYPNLMSSLTPSPSRLSLYSVELSEGSSEPGSGTRAAMSPATNLRSLSACSSPMPVHSAAPPPRVSVAAHSTQTSPSAATSPPALEEKLNKHILFVDDEPTIGKLASRFLQKLGCTFTVLKDGDQVAATLQSTPKKFDVVFLDIVMPKMSGEEACALVRQFDSTTPIIAATANTSAQDQQRYISVGFNGCLAKPYSIADMKAAILQHSTIPE